jgi:PhnB protein
MPEPELIERLDAAVEAMLHGPEAARVPEDPEMAELWRVAADLALVPREGFRARLEHTLARRSRMSSVATSVQQLHRAATPFLTLKDPAAAIEFYERAFGAVELLRLTEPGGAIAHAEIRIGEAHFKLGHEYAELGLKAPETLGGSPVRLHLYVDDVDALVERAAAAGARVERPPTDEFYGNRAARLQDPFGLTWLLATPKEILSEAEMQRRLDELMQAAPKPVKAAPEGFRSLTPYLLARGAGRLIDFMKQAFGAEELLRVPAPDGTIRHAVVRIGDSMLELGDALEDWPARPAAIHLYVPDADAVYARAVAAGAETLFPLGDRPYGDREADIRDPFGNNWYIGTRKQGGPIPEGMHSITPTLHVQGTDRLIDFIRQAFGADELERTAVAGVVVHAQLKLGDSVLELGEARGPVSPMPCAIHYYVEDADAVYARALAAGATSIGAPSDRPYGDRAAEVADPFGNYWFIATRLKDVPQQPR